MADASRPFRVDDLVVFKDAAGSEKGRRMMVALFGPGPFRVRAVVNHGAEFAVKMSLPRQQLFIVPDDDRRLTAKQVSAEWFTPYREEQGCA